MKNKVWIGAMLICVLLCFSRCMVWTGRYYEEKVDITVVNEILKAVEKHYNNPKQP